MPLWVLALVMLAGYLLKPPTGYLAMPGLDIGRSAGAATRRDDRLRNPGQAWHRGPARGRLERAATGLLPLLAAW
jgi:hypothetical protein